MISITNPTGRSTECRAVNIGSSTTLYFSYETLIGFDTFNDETGKREVHRISNSWGPTTGRHFNECGLKLTEEDLVENGGSHHHHRFDTDKLAALALEAIKKEN